MKPRTNFDAVQSGVFEAFDGAIRNATSCPTADILWAIQEGVRLSIDPAITFSLIREAITEGTRQAILELNGGGKK